MKLVEIVVGNNTTPTTTTTTTSPQTVTILQHLTKLIGKIGVTVGNCNGFVGNRMVNTYSAEATFLLAEGAAETVCAVDHAIAKIHGMALGPFQMADLAGNDIGYFIRKEKGMTRDPKTSIVGPNRPQRYTELPDDMVTKLGRLGQKTSKGWYDYDPKIGKGRKGLPSKEMAQFIQKYIPKTPSSSPTVFLTPQQIIERCFFGLVNEGFKILEEGMAARPSDIDVIYLYGYGWPVWRGGPMYWADHEIGLERLLNTLSTFHQRFPGSDYFKPAQLLKTCVRMNITVEDYYRKGYHLNKNKNNTMSKL
eukprot:CAMPEP_0202446020 /NCGR_PEP_ID=MMETSP1360-20130828/4680_1 /ASSEMBLY_ACC=CAM_ASM_000848 /TAXON_ID=515479 /ORGANISM="Licmophora paradoxa, Strain CCMP2313" /LENGTH=306 /DNA_ID=CAMNT_0049062437 /DNA_START=415 /DNA_END=1335 /DNA_ORIENTATION=-